MSTGDQHASGAARVTHRTTEQGPESSRADDGPLVRENETCRSFRNC
jgi:hypothetical protein